MAAINVKVKTAKVIAALETKLAELKTADANDDMLRQAYDEAMKAYEVAVLDAVKHLEPESVNVWDYRRTEVTVKYDVTDAVLPGRPTMPNTSGLPTGAIPEIEAAIRLLRMTDDETVNASTFKQISKYL